MKLIDKLALIHIYNRKVLFVRSKGKDIFYTVGGKRNPGETDEQALTRECKEEIGVDIIQGSPKYLVTFNDKVHGNKEMDIKLTCYSADFIGSPKPCSEIEEMAWFNTSNTDKTTDTGASVLKWLKERNLID